jgi:uncharacterized protein (DUF924 family)
LVEGGLEKDYAELSLDERAFFLMPLMHAEDVARQDECVKRFGELCDFAAEPRKPGVQRTLQYAIAHRNIVARFGRFPHRNTLLGRTSTGEEIEFLKEPGSSF